jgi:hypothetical protein
MRIHPTASELIPTMLDELKPLERACAGAVTCTGEMEEHDIRAAQDRH